MWLAARMCSFGMKDVDRVIDEVFLKRSAGFAKNTLPRHSVYAYFDSAESLVPELSSLPAVLQRQAQRLILACIYTRHNDGFVRVKHASGLLDANEETANSNAPAGGQPRAEHWR